MATMGRLSILTARHCTGEAGPPEFAACLSLFPRPCVDAAARATLPHPPPLPRYDYEQTLALDNVAAIAALDPSKFMLGTEACVLEALEYGWGIGELYAADILGDLNHGVAGWVQWNAALLIGDRYPYWRGGPNHDNTTSFGDPLLFEYNTTGTQRLVKQSSYWIIGHVSRYASPGSHRVTSGGAGVASTAAEYDDVRASALGQHHTAPLKLLASAFLSSDGATVSTVVVNPTDAAVDFKLRDVVGARAAHASIPPHSVQTYTWDT